MRRFVERGTFVGVMIDVIARLGVFVDTIELDPVLAKRAQAIFESRQNVSVHQSDTSAIVLKIRGKINEQIIF